ncbi:hypothetical protein MSAN_01505400 [Mycena sanguinolenta]|uniref:Uncharacterized protein n=1 Tax=Mycena sanguinolenta TaxID=230812 RepID=A0A8H6Y311_9AGAR|nr:hypothetical protein MSAN_01505400 [Mycena sanguinolenta]
MAATLPARRVMLGSAPRVDEQEAPKNPRAMVMSPLTCGFGGSGGEGRDQGGDGGTGQGPTVYFGQPEARESSEFQTIRLGDLKLIKEVHLSLQSGVVGRQSRGVGVQRIYHAKIRRDPGAVTVAMYQGDGAEEEAIEYIFNAFPESSIDYGSAAWMQSTTGELCLGLAPGGPETTFQLPCGAVRIARLEKVSLDAPDSEDMIISSLSEDQYHQLCSQSPIAKFQYFQVSTEHPVGPGIFWLDSQYRTCVKIMEPLQILPEEELHWENHGRVPDALLPNSWIRYDSSRTSSLQLELQAFFLLREFQKSWVAQANHIFAELEEVAHVEDYVCIDEVQFMLRIADKHHIPGGYLFVCPPQDFRTGTEPHVNVYQWPACPAYWSLDPSGADRLSTEDARILGFPTIHIETTMSGFSRDHSVYKGLRRFHEGKGFDPDSQEVARKLGYPLYEVLSDRMPFPAREVTGHGQGTLTVPREIEADPTQIALFSAIEGPATCAHARRRRNGMKATVPPVQLWNHQDAAASGSSVDLSLDLLLAVYQCKRIFAILFSSLACVTAGTLHAPKVNLCAPELDANWLTAAASALLPDFAIAFTVYENQQEENMRRGKDVRASSRRRAGENVCRLPHQLRRPPRAQQWPSRSYGRYTV